MNQSSVRRPGDARWHAAPDAEKVKGKVSGKDG